MPNDKKTLGQRLYPDKIEKGVADAAGRVNKPADNSRTPVYSGAEARRMEHGGAYKDPKTGKRKLFEKQYKA